MEAAEAYAAGEPVTSPPPSLRLYSMAKRLPGLWSATDLLEEDGQLLVELEFYANVEARVANEHAARERSRQERDNRKGSTPGRRRRFGRKRG